jgi:hypothetical protein
MQKLVAADHGKVHQISVSILTDSGRGLCIHEIFIHEDVQTWLSFQLNFLSNPW